MARVARHFGGLAPPEESALSPTDGRSWLSRLLFVRAHPWPTWVPRTTIDTNLLFSAAAALRATPVSGSACGPEPPPSLSSPSSRDIPSTSSRSGTARPRGTVSDKKRLTSLHSPRQRLVSPPAFAPAPPTSSRTHPILPPPPDTPYPTGSLARPRSRGFERWSHPRDDPALGWEQPGHAWLAQHYGRALRRAFDERNHSHVVVVEDDMLLSADFLRLFLAAAPLLDADPSIWRARGPPDGRTRSHAQGAGSSGGCLLIAPTCPLPVSACPPGASPPGTTTAAATWSSPPPGASFPRGYPLSIPSPPLHPASPDCTPLHPSLYPFVSARLYRTDYFPGLGWMLTRRLWAELGPEWPEQNWDHWMRGEEARRPAAPLCSRCTARARSGLPGRHGRSLSDQDAARN